MPCLGRLSSKKCNGVSLVSSCASNCKCDMWMGSQAIRTSPTGQRHTRARDGEAGSRADPVRRYGKGNAWPMTPAMLLRLDCGPRPEDLFLGYVALVLLAGLRRYSTPIRTERFSLRRFPLGTRSSPPERTQKGRCAELATTFSVSEPRVLR
jgi:hypothetical protein